MRLKSFLPWALLPAWLLIMLAIAAAGLYLGYRAPDIAVAVVLLFFLGAWIFWMTWQSQVRP